MNNPTTRTPAYKVNDRVTTLINGLLFVGQVIKVRPPDSEHVTHRYYIATASGTEFWVAEPLLQHAAPRVGIG